MTLTSSELWLGEMFDEMFVHLWFLVLARGQSCSERKAFFLYYPITFREGHKGQSEQLIVVLCISHLVIKEANMLSMAWNLSVRHHRKALSHTNTVEVNFV